jgi:hypothetical protein
MPYISQGDRQDLDDRDFYIPDLGDAPVGTLTYILYRACLEYLISHDHNYATRADVLGALESAKLEFYRRQVAPYEDYKITQNGDVHVRDF